MSFGNIEEIWKSKREGSMELTTRDEGEKKGIFDRSKKTPKSLEK